MEQEKKRSTTGTRTKTKKQALPECAELQFVAQVSRIIEKQLSLIELKTDEMLSEQELRDKTPLNQITAALGALFDKRALVRGESTTNETLRIELAPELEEYAK